MPNKDDEQIKAEIDRIMENVDHIMKRVSACIPEKKEADDGKTDTPSPFSEATSKIKS
jgi:hypothetical protein